MTLLTNEPRPKPKPQKSIKVVESGKRKYKFKTERQTLKKKLDDVVREIILDRDNGCVLPAVRPHAGRRTRGHVISCTAESVEWDLYNVNEQCGGCNYYHEHRADVYIDWFIQRFGLEEWNRLRHDADHAEKLQVYELQELLDQLKKIRQKQIQSMLMGEPWKPYFTQKDILSGAWNK